MYIAQLVLMFLRFVQTNASGFQSALEYDGGVVQRLPFNISDYNRLEDIEAEMDAMAGRCPAAISCVVESIGLSYEQRDIKVLRITKPEAGRTGYWIDAGIHAREWLAQATLLKVMDHLTRNYEIDPEVTSLINRYDWQLLPVLNPDGYVYSWDVDRMWRKSVEPIDGSSCLGTDLNRNFDHFWMNDGASTQPCNEGFGGTGPASAIETSRTQTELVRLGDSLTGVLSLHAGSQRWLHSWGYTEDGVCAIAPDHDDLTLAVNAAADATEATFDTEWGRGSYCLTIYPGSGNVMDYAKALAGIKYTFTPELRGPEQIVDASNIEPSFQEFFNGLKALVDQIEITEGGK